MEKIALVTGGTRGIGFGIAKSLANDGFHLAINGVREEQAADSALNELRSYGTRVVYCRGNIGIRLEREMMLKKVKENFNYINVLVNNAGMGPRDRKDILEASEESFAEVMQVNLEGPYFLTQAVANIMIHEKKKNHNFEACIITVTSVSSTLASLNRGEYCVSKAGLSMMTQLYAVRLGEFNIPVYEIRPGIVNTDMTAGVKEKYDKMIDEGLLIQKRWGQPADVGKAVVMLARGDLSYSTGQVIMTDGGMTIGRF